MKEYPKRPFLISGHRYEQLWLVLPLCFISIFARGCGIIGAICIFLMWFFYSIAVSEQEWKKSCDNGVASIYSSKEYLESQGFREQFSIGTEKIKTIVVTNEELKEIQKQKELYISKKKKRVKEMIIDLCTYDKMCILYKSGNEEAKQYLSNIGQQLLDGTYKYMPQNEVNKLMDTIVDNNGEILSSLKERKDVIAHYYFIWLEYYLHREIISSHREIITYLYGNGGKFGYVVSKPEDYYQKLKRGEDIFENPYN